MVEGFLNICVGDGMFVVDGLVCVLYVVVMLVLLIVDDVLCIDVVDVCVLWNVLLDVFVMFML